MLKTVTIEGFVRCPSNTSYDLTDTPFLMEEKRPYNAKPDYAGNMSWGEYRQ